MLSVVVVLLAQIGPTAGAWSSARPPECVAIDGGRGANIWERAKAPELHRYCDLLANGAAKLAGSAGQRQDVVEIAQRADKLVPGHAAPSVLMGRALMRMGRFEEALTALNEAKKREERALDDPYALHALARALLRTGHPVEASQAYRSLLPRTSSLTLADRSAATIEAGLLAMDKGAAGLDEAVPIFRQAARDSQDVAQIVGLLCLALALDRAGDEGEARALLAERARGDMRTVLSGPQAKDLFAPDFLPETHALAALALESTDMNAARESWRRYLAARPTGPWAAHARAHESGGAKRGTQGRP